MQPIQSNQGKGEVLKNSHNHDNRTQTGTSSSQRANNTNNNALLQTNNNSSLYSRELRQPSVVKDDYTEEVNRLLLLEALEYIQLINRVLKKGGKSRFSIKASESEPIEKLMFKAIEGCSKIDNDRLRKLYAQERKVGKSKPQSCTDNLEAHGNAEICWMTYSFIFQNYFLFETERKVLLDFKSTQKPNDIIVQNIDLTIRDAIKELEKIKNECYFSIFGIMTNPSRKLISKADKMANYIEGSDKFSESNLFKLKTLDEIENFGLGVGHFLEQVLEIQIRKMACHLSKLQILLDCLNKIKKLPKTVDNLTIAYKILSDCHAFYKQDNSAYKHNGEQPTQCWKDYCRVKTFLTDLARKLALQINDATNRHKAELEKKAQLAIQNNLSASQISASSEKPQSKKLKNNRQATPIENISKEAKDFETSKNKPDHEEKKEEAISKPDDHSQTTNISGASEPVSPMPPRDHEVSDIVEEKEVKEKPEVIISTVQSIEKIKEIVIIDEDLEEDNLDDIEPETNALMEVLRQLFDKDRAAKLERKKEKFNKTKIVIEEEGIASSDIKSKVVSQVLSSTHQDTVKALFKEKPEHLTILGNDVKNLITALKGKSVGASGSQFNIFWNGSNKHAGEFEIAHGGDRKGYLTSKYAGRVADAIHIGVTHEYIERDLFPQELLMIIENHVIANNA